MLMLLTNSFRFFCFTLIPILALVTNCKTAQKSVSDPEFVMSEDGRMLTVAPDSSRDGFCVLSFDKDNAVNTELLTPSGYTRNQLGKVLRYMGIPETLIVGTITNIAGVFTGIKASKKILKKAHETFDDISLVKGATKIGGFALAIAGGIYTGKVVYRVIRGKQEGEEGKSLIAGGLFGGWVLGPTVELIRRGRRVDTIISTQETYKVSDKKMEVIISRIKDMPGDSSGNCDHLK